MLFNSIDFAFFLPIVFTLYWFVFNKNLKIQNLLIVIASYFFYGWWDWRFLILIFLSTLVDYAVGLALSKEDKKSKRKLLLWTSIVFNLGLLCYFKYANFFIGNFNKAFTFFGSELNINTLNIILPVGISFYTFQTLSYTIDIYRKKLEPTKDFIAFMGFVSFFPQLVAGPVEKAANLLPQFYKKRTVNDAQFSDGMRQILWGLFKKVVIADNCANYVDLVYKNPTDHSGSTLLLGAVMFSFQIYCDFSGYSDIAIGTARIFGFNLMKNFSFPFFARNMSEFWGKWHISITLWFREYFFKALGRSRKNSFKRRLNITLMFVVIGFWHGANWTFIIWGLVNTVYYLAYSLLGFNTQYRFVVAKDAFLPSLKEFFQMSTNFGLLTLSLIIFRAKNIASAIDYMQGIVNVSILSTPKMPPTVLSVLIILFLLTEWIFRECAYGLQLNENKINKPMRWVIYLIISFLIAFFLGGKDNFIYFQF